MCEFSHGIFRVVGASYLIRYEITKVIFCRIERKKYILRLPPSHSVQPRRVIYAEVIYAVSQSGPGSPVDPVVPVAAIIMHNYRYAPAIG